MRCNSQTIVLNGTQASSGLAIPALAQDSVNMVVSNKGPDDVFIVTGPTAPTAVFPTNSVPQAGTVVLAGAIMTIAKNQRTDTYVAAICPSGDTATVYVQFGNGD